jgi:cysteine-rich repeat protein
MNFAFGRVLLALAIATVAACGDNYRTGDDTVGDDTVGDDTSGGPPAIEAVTLTTAEDTAVTQALVITEPDGDEVTIELGAPDHGAVTLDGSSITYTPGADYAGADEFTIRVVDVDGEATVTAAVTVTPVNDAPVGVGDTFSTGEDTALLVLGSTLVANDTDADADPLTVTAVGTATNGTAVLAAGDITFTPTANFVGDATFEYTVSDGTATATATVAIAVGGVNDPPVATDDALTTAEDTVLVVDTAGLVANDTDPESSPLMVTEVGAATNGTAVLAAGDVTFTPTAGFSGTASFEYTVSDGSATDVGVATVTVTAVNDAPVAVDDLATTAEGTPITITFATLLANDTDVDGPTPTITAAGSGLNGTAVLGAGSITFTPTPDFFGTASFQYTVSDGTLTDVGVVAVTVTPVNDAPVATDDTATTAEGAPVAIALTTLLANDTDIDGPALTITAAGTAINGTAVLGASSITFTPTADFAGTASFQYTVSDGTLTDVGVVTVTVTPVNDAPVVTDDAATTAEDTPITIAFATLLANDTDLDGPAPTITAAGAGINGTAVLGASSITFTPTPDFAGTASFEYTVSDGTLTDVGLVTVTVTPVNDPPVAGDDVAAVQTDGSVEIALATLTANDDDGGDGGPLVVTAVQDEVSGTAVLGAASVTFTPEPGFSGTASFEYVVSDGGATDVGLVVVTVTSGPVCGDGAIEGVETCDDGNGVPGDGCSAACGVEAGYVCAGAPSVCTPICGDGIAVGDEPCDDGDPDETDGCTSLCVVGAPCTTAELPGADRLAVDPLTGHCYAAFDDTATTFADAAQACLAGGGYLATITSAGEAGVVDAILGAGQSPWIGAQDDANDTDAVFDWVTTEAWNFVRFAAGEPDDSGECVHVTGVTGEWADADCASTTSAVGALCEVAPVACGDSVIQASQGEECDDANTTSGDGCSVTCQVDLGCGNGVVEAGEACDDDNLANGDGCSSTCAFENLVRFTFTGAMGNEVSRPADGAAPAPGLDAIPVMTRGPGAVATTASNTFNANGWNTADLDPTAYYAFTVTPAASFAMNLQVFEFDEQRSGTGPVTYVVRSSLDGFTADLATGATAAALAPHQILLGAEFTNLTAPVEFRIYAFGTTASGGTWRIDNVEVYGFTDGP